MAKKKALRPSRGTTLQSGNGGALQEQTENRITALYARVSTDAQFEEGYSLDAQLEKMHQWCALKEIGNPRDYPDGGYSGASLDRPQMQRLIEDISNGLISRVVVYKLDRLSRSQRDTVFLLEELFLPNGIDFISLSENFDTGTPYGKAMIGIFSVFAQLERENIYERTRMGMLERVKSGKWPGGGGTPFGYDYVPEQDTLIPNEHAEEVRQIYDLYLSGYSTTQLARMYPVANDHQITQILERPTYLGKISYNGVLYEGMHAPIIDEETWNRVQQERSRRSRKSAVTSQYLLSGLLCCGRCGAKMRYQKWGKQTKIWCNSQDPSKPHLVKDPNCTNFRYDAAEVEAFVIEQVLRLSDLYPAEKLNTSAMAKKRSGGTEVLQAKYDAQAAKVARLYNLYGDTGDTQLLHVIEQNRSELHSISVMLENEKSSALAVQEIAERQQAVRNLRARWASLSFREKQRVIRLCIDRVVLDGDEVVIRYAFASDQ